MTKWIEAARTSDSRWARMLRVFLPLHEEAEAEESTFNKGLSPILLLAVSPLIGLLFLMFLPVVGFGMLFFLVGKAVRQSVLKLAGHAAPEPGSRLAMEKK